jgi:hypothetical protein
MHVDETPDHESGDRPEHQRPQDPFGELHGQSQAERFALETQLLVDLLNNSLLSTLITENYEEVDDGNYYELETLEQLKDQLARFLGLQERGFGPDESFEQESLYSNDFDEEPTSEKPQLEPADLDFEIHRSLVKRDEDGEIVARSLLIEPRVLGHDGDIWCFPDIIRSTDGSQLLSREAVRSPLLLNFKLEEDGMSFSVHFTESGVEEIYHNAAADLNTLPPGMKKDIASLAIRFCQQIGLPDAFDLTLEDIEMRQPHRIDPEQQSFDFAIEPLGIFRVSIRRDPATAGIQMGMQALELRSPM